MLEREAVTIAVRLQTGLNLDAMNLIACINQTVVRGVVANRKGNIEALA